MEDGVNGEYYLNSGYSLEDRINDITVKTEYLKKHLKRQFWYRVEDLTECWKASKPETIKGCWKKTELSNFH